jgi:hypothetical protein
MQNTWNFCFFAALGLVAGACGDAGRAGTGEVTSRDSSGITIVESAGQQWGMGEEWTVDSVPRLSIGATDGPPEQLFTTIVGAGVLPDQHIFVGDSGAREIRIFGPDGRIARTLGRGGNGPGEFTYLRAARRCGSGRVVGFDWNGVVVFDGSGDLVRTFTINEPGMDRSPYGLVCGATGEFIATGWGDHDYESYPTRPTTRVALAPIWLLDTLGVVRADLGLFTSSERIFLPNAAGTGGTDAPHPLGRAAVFALRDEGVVVGEAAMMEVRLFQREGRAQAIFRGPADDLTITPADLDAYSSAKLVRRDSVLRDRLAAVDFPGPKTLPAYNEMIVDAGGNIWLGRFDAPWRDDTRWAVFERTGAFLGHVQVPPRMRLFEIGEDYLLGARKNEVDVETVVMLRLNKGR